MTSKKTAAKETSLRAVHERGKTLLADKTKVLLVCEYCQSFFLHFVPKLGDVLPASLTITAFCVSSRVSRAEARQKREYI